MATLTERVTVSLPRDVKRQLKERALKEGVSLSAVMRDIVDDLVAEHDLMVTIATIEQRDATIQ